MIEMSEVMEIVVVWGGGERKPQPCHATGQEIGEIWCPALAGVGTRSRLSLLGALPCNSLRRLCPLVVMRELSEVRRMHERFPACNGRRPVSADASCGRRVAIPRTNARQHLNVD
jgi:hypothetical protein